MKSYTLFFVTIVFVDIFHSAFGNSSHLGSDDASAGAATDPFSRRRSTDAITDRFLAGAPSTKGASCKKYPFVCRLRGSAGPDCCKYSCVNTSADKSNCGRCGKKCKHGEACCGGQCVNLSFNTSHCDRCFNKCSSGDSCSYGLCAYA